MRKSCKVEVVLLKRPATGVLLLSREGKLIKYDKYLKLEREIAVILQVGPRSYHGKVLKRI
jgi:hypothetical protein